MMNHQTLTWKTNTSYPCPSQSYISPFIVTTQQVKEAKYGDIYAILMCLIYFCLERRKYEFYVFAN